MAMTGGRTWSEVLPRRECLRFMAGGTLGRLGVSVGGHIEIFPVNYVLDGDDIIVRMDRGTKHAAILREPRVAFEVDAVSETDRTGWSVLVGGLAQEIIDPAELNRLALIGPDPLPPGRKPLWIRIAADHISGRRIHGRHPASRPRGQGGKARVALAHTTSLMHGSDHHLGTMERSP